ncbi:MAG: IPT/TIG domain-containing protein [Planctomycetaceae bacterium]|nr:IPT/TIG domain-containing protein [Planctomycetaceae bacterium]
MKGYVIEWSGDCDGDGVVDLGQIAAGELEDVNGNGRPECCEGAGAPTEDCNANGEADACELETDGADTDLDLVLDTCERAFGDLDLDGVVGAGDLALLLEAWGLTGEGAAGELVGDLDLDGVVGAADLSLLLARWGERAPWELPTVRAVSPANGPAEGGTRIAITGWNLSGATSIEIGEDVATDVVVVDETRILATTPAGPVGPATVIVRTPADVAELVDAFTYESTYSIVPTITSVSPSSGPLGGGTTITVTGTNLTGATSVKVGTVACTSVTVVSATQLTAVTPAGTVGAKSVSVTTAGGTGTKASAFTYFAVPTITAVAPASGPQGGGTTITITGTNLTGTTSVAVAGVACTGVTVVSATQLTAVTPAAATTGAKTVSVTTPGGTASKTNGFTYVPAPTIASVSPSVGPVAGGTTITITGTNLTGATSVKVSAVACTSVTVVSPTQLTAVTSAGNAGLKSVSVTTPGGTATLPGAFTLVGLPTITSVSPSAGPTAGGTTITVTGTNLTGATSVKVGAVACTSVTVVSATQLTAVTPAGTVGAKSVTVTTAGGTGTKASAFTYFAVPTITAVAPASGPQGGGTTITITGTNLNGTTAVEVGGVACTAVTVVSATTVTAVTASGTVGAKSVSVTTPGGTATKSNAFTYLFGPTIASIAPAAGPKTGGTALTILGTNLTGTTSVKVNGVSCTSVTVVSATQLTAVTPAGTVGAKPVSVTTAAGTVTRSNGFTYMSAPTITSVSPTSGSISGGTTITITGTNLTGTTSVAVAGVACTGVTVVSATQLTAVTPAGATTGAKSVSVTTPGGTATKTSAFVYFPVPTIATVTPAAGPASGGTTIAVTGTNLTGTTSVKVGTVACTQVTVVSSTQLTARTPAGASGVKSVSVTTPGGTATLPSAFTYVAAPTITSVTPGAGALAGGQTITITGTNLSGVTTVTVGGVPCTSVTVVSATQVTAVTPVVTAAGARAVSVSSPGGTVSQANAFIYFPLPQITSVTPAIGPNTGGTTITVNGLNLLGTSEVRVDGFACTGVTQVSGTSVRAVTPAGTLGVKTVSVTTPGGTWITADAFTYVEGPSITSVSPSSGPLAGGTPITITGVGFTGATSVKIGGVACTSVTVMSATSITAVTPAGTAGAKTVDVSTPVGTGSLNGGFTYVAPWFTVLEQTPNASVVTNSMLRNAIIATGLPWRVRDNITQIEMLLIPPGTFTMGCQATATLDTLEFLCSSFPSEGPTHAVTISQPFYLGRYEVTQAQFVARFGSNPSFFTSSSPQVSVAEIPNRPAENMSYLNITGPNGFLAGTGLRLPTEAEWEYACRAGTTTAYHGYVGNLGGTNQVEKASDIAWHGQNQSPLQTRPVGLKAANGLGLHDMSGNVHEWCSDWFDFSFYTPLPVTDPTGPATGTSRVFRGGSWEDGPVLHRSSTRFALPPTLSSAKVGFRVARNPG